MSDTIILKHGGKRPSESYRADKLHASIEAACAAVSLPSGVAEDSARRVVATVELWLQNKPEVTSADLRRVAAQALTVVSPEAGYLYKHHNTMV